MKNALAIIAATVGVGYCLMLAAQHFAHLFTTVLDKVN